MRYMFKTLPISIKKSVLVILAIGVGSGLAASFVAQKAEAATSSTALNPLPLRELYTQPNQAYLYTSNWSEAEAAQQSYGLTMPSKRPLGYVFSKTNPDTRTLYRLKQKSNGVWLMSVSQSEVDALTKPPNAPFTLEGITGYIYNSPQPGAEQINRYHNSKGWRMAYQSQDASLKAAGYQGDGPMGYMLKSYTQVGAYYFSSFDDKSNPYFLQAVKNVYGRYPDPWGGVRDFSGQDPNVPQNTQGWTGDWSYLKPSIGYYDDSQPAVLEQQIDQAASHGLTYFAFYNYWNNQTGTTQYDSAINAFTAATNNSRMKFMITPCIAPSSTDPEHLMLPVSQYAAAADAFASYTTKANYLTTQDGRPMMFMCDVRGAGNGSIVDQNQFLGQLRQAIKNKTGKDPFILNHSEYGLETARQLTGDGYTCLNLGSYIQSGSYSSYISGLGNYFTTFDNSGKPMLRCGMSGFNEAPRTNLFMPKDQVRYFRDNTKSQFPSAMQATLTNMKNQPASQTDNYMTMYAWNEWHEGGFIEPNVRDNDYYLRTLQSIFGLPGN